MGLRKSIAAVVGAALTVGLVLAAPAAVAGGGGMHCPDSPYYGEASGPSAVIELEHSCFTPTVVYVEPGTEVTFRNNDPVPHNLSGPMGSFAEGIFKDLRGGAEVSFTLEDEGVFPYMCYLHPGMSGAIVVGAGRDSGGETVDVEGAASDLGDGGGGSEATASLLLGLGIASVLLVAAVVALAGRKARPVSTP